MNARLRRQTSLDGDKSSRLTLGFTLSIFVVASTGCSDSGTNPSAAASESIISLEDVNNYSGVAALQIPVVKTAANADLAICFDAITANLQCHNLDPRVDLDNVVFLQISGQTQGEVTRKLEADTLATSDASAYFQFNTDHSSNCVALSEMNFVGNNIDLSANYPEDPASTYLVLFSKGTVPGKGAQAMLYLEPTSDSANTEVLAETGCQQLEFLPDLSSPTPLSLENEGPWVIDWSSLSVDGMGNPMHFQDVDRLLIGFYEAMTLDQLEEQVFDLETLPSHLWERPVTPGERSADLSEAKKATGEPFSTFVQEREGIWIFALLCSNCQTPAPLVMTVLQPGD